MSPSGSYIFLYTAATRTCGAPSRDSMSVSGSSGDRMSQLGGRDGVAQEAGRRADVGAEPAEAGEESAGSSAACSRPSSRRAAADADPGAA